MEKTYSYMDMLMNHLHQCVATVEGSLLHLHMCYNVVSRWDTSGSQQVRIRHVAQLREK